MAKLVSPFSRPTGPQFKPTLWVQHAWRALAQTLVPMIASFASHGEAPSGPNLNRTVNVLNKTQEIAAYFWGNVAPRSEKWVRIVFLKTYFWHVENVFQYTLVRLCVKKQPIPLNFIHNVFDAQKGWNQSVCPVSSAKRIVPHNSSGFFRALSCSVHWKRFFLTGVLQTQHHQYNSSISCTIRGNGFL